MQKLKIKIQPCLVELDGVQNNRLRIFFLLGIFIYFLLFLPLANAAFKDGGWGVRPSGMGGAFTAISDDVSGILYNPAGLSRLNHAEFNFMYAKLYAGLDAVNLGLNYVAFAYPVSNIGTFGVNWANFISVKQYRQDSVSLSYSGSLNKIIERVFRKRLKPAVDYGINLKYLSHSYVLDRRTINDPVFSDGNSKANLSLDFGLLAKPSPLKLSGLLLGFMLKNINQPDMGLKTRDIVPVEIRGGISYLWNKWGNVEDIVLGIDFSYRNQEWGSRQDKINLHLGGEFWLFKRVIGFRMGGNSGELSSGFSVSTPENFMLDLKLDYAFLWPLFIRESIGSHRVALTYQFGGKR